MADMEPGKKRSHGYAWLVGIGIIIAGMFYFYYPFLTRDLGPRQPIYFSHRVHAGVKEINCRFCHPYVERSQNAGIPPIEKCFFCHKYIIPNHPQIVKERQHYDSGKPVPWVRIFWLPDYVFFNHIPHIKWAGLDCTNCHGDIKTMDRLVATDLKMGFCIECHRQRHANLDCWLACHR